MQVLQYSLVLRVFTADLGLYESRTKMRQIYMNNLYLIVQFTGGFKK